MESVAPWAEPVLVTAGELLERPGDEWRYELVDGRLVRMSPTGGRHGRIVMALLRAIDGFVEENNLGAVFPPETGFWISTAGEPDTVLAPDIAFVRRDRELESGIEGYPRLAPDLIVEVASPSQGPAEMAVKAQRWLQAGVRLAWIVLPATQVVEVWRDGELDRVLGPEASLSGEDVLQGFLYPVEQLFR